MYSISFFLLSSISLTLVCRPFKRSACVEVNVHVCLCISWAFRGHAKCVKPTWGTESHLGQQAHVLAWDLFTGLQSQKHDCDICAVADLMPYVCGRGLYLSVETPHDLLFCAWNNNSKTVDFFSLYSFGTATSVMCLRVGMAYRCSSVCTILLKPSFSTTLYGRSSLHMKTATDSVISCAQTEPGASFHIRDLSSCVCFESTDLAMGCCRTSAWCRLRWFRRFVVLLQYFRTAWQSLHTLLLSLSCVPGLHRNTKLIHTSAFSGRHIVMVWSSAAPVRTARITRGCCSQRPPLARGLNWFRRLINRYWIAGKRIAMHCWIDIFTHP